MSGTARVRVALVLAALLAIAAVAGCTTASTTATVAPSKVVTPTVDAKSTGDQGDAEVAEPVSAGQWTISLVAVRGEPQFEGTKPAAGHEYLVLNINARNNGSASASLTSADFTLTGTGGVVYPPKKVTAAQWVDGMSAVKPGASASAIGIMYEVPSGSTGLQLVFAPAGSAAAKPIFVR